MGGEKLAEGILATTRSIRDENELTRIAKEMEVNTETGSERLARKQAEIDEQAEIGRVSGRERRQRETALRLEIQERVQTQNLQQRNGEPELAQEVTIEDRLKQAAISTRD